VGARGTDPEDEGAAYVFVRLGTNWTQQARLIGNDSIADDSFGGSVAISGDTIVVGSQRHDVAGTTNNNKGAAFVFTRANGVWTQQTKLTASNPGPYDFFGAHVAIDGNTIIVGAPDSSGIGSFNPGSAYIFTRAGNTWSQQTQLLANDAAHDDLFGDAVSISGDTVVVG